jgi:hypothetical protein
MGQNIKTTLFDFLNENNIEKKNNSIICYHRSSSFNHMINNTFDLNRANSYSIFGEAIYFSESPNISSIFGNYVCKFSILLKEPVLNLNDKITKKYARELVRKFNNMFNLNMDINIDEVNQIGDIFIQNNYCYYKQFINSLGYNSFKYYSNYYTDFINKKGDYGLCYGVYNTDDITYVDGPF